MPGEERRSMSIGSDAEEDEVEDGEARGVLRGELTDELGLVCVCELVEVVEEGGVDGVYVLGWKGDFGV